MQAADSEQREELEKSLDAWQHLLWQQHAELIGVDGMSRATKTRRKLYKDDRAARAVRVKANDSTDNKTISGISD